MKKKVTSTDIAHAAGVSQSTVSMILNKSTMYHLQGYCGKSGKCGKRTGICPAEAENEKRNKTGEASCCILPKPDESVLCYVASGD